MAVQQLFPKHSFGRRRILTAIVAAGASLALAAGCASSPGVAEQTAATSAASETLSTPDSPPPGSESSSAPAPSSGSSSETPSADAFPVTVTASNGDVTIATKPVSIASLSATATEMLYAIGAGDQVTVVDKNSDYPAGLTQPRVDSYQLNIEALTAFKPDLVITSGASPDQESTFKTLGMTMISETAPANIDGTYAQILQLGQVTGHIDQASALVAKMKAEIAEIYAQAPVTTKPLTYYYELDQTFYSVTSDTFIGSLLTPFGLASIADKAQGAAAAGGYPQLSVEYILKANPDYILLADTSCCEQTAATVAARDGWKALSAVSDGRIVGLNDDIASRWGPRVVDLLRTVLQGMKAHPVA